MTMYTKSEGEITNIFTSTRPLSSAMTYSDAVEIQRSGTFGIWMSGGPASACSAAQLCMWYELAPDSTATDFISAGSIFVNWNGLSAVASGKAITPYPMPWMRIGLSATNALVTSGAKVDTKLFAQ
jgi:hypothetical protein